MSDIMLNAVIQMPYEMAMKDELSRRQFYERANQALRERNAKSAEIERLRAALILAEGAMNYMGDILNGMDAVEPEDEQATEPAFLAVRAALSGEPT